jgi:hypothetical protein
MSPTDEAAAILIRVFESLARANGKTLKPSTRADIRRACELLSSAGTELDDLLDDAPRVSPGEAATVPSEVQQWRRERDARH